MKAYIFRTKFIVTSTIILIIFVLLTSIKNSSPSTSSGTSQNLIQEKFKQINSQNTASFITKYLNIEGDLNSKGMVGTEINISSEATITDILKTNAITSSIIYGSKLVTEIIRSRENELEINGNIILVNEIEAKNINLDTSYLQLGTLNWILIDHVGFEGFNSNNDKSTGSYRNVELQECGFSYQEINRTLNIENCKKGLIKAQIVFNGEWKEHEKIYMKIDGKIKWSGGLNDYLVEVEFDCHKNQLKENNKVITFGSNLLEDPCIKSFFVDDFQVYTK